MDQMHSPRKEVGARASASAQSTRSPQRRIIRSLPSRSQQYGANSAKVELVSAQEQVATFQDSDHVTDALDVGETVPWVLPSFRLTWCSGSALSSHA